MHILFSVLIGPLPLLLASLPASPQSAAPQPAARATNTCQQLAGLTLFRAEITAASVVPAGKFNGPRETYTGQDLSAFYKVLPGFCRVIAHAHPSSDSDIGIEV